MVKVLDGDELGKRAGYSRPHTVHCGPGAVFMSCLGGYGEEGPGGIALLDQNSFDVQGAWEADRGDQFLAYDVWWHVLADVAITSEWGTPAMIEDGVVPELLLGRKYGHRLHFWDMKSRKLIETVDLGDQHQMVLELRPAHDPTKKYGFVGVVVSVEDLSASIWMWHEDGGQWTATKVITIPAEPAPAEQLPPLLQGFGAVPPLVTDINLSVDDKYLYVSCWGTGELKQYDVCDPLHPVETGSVRIGGIVGRVAHPARPDQPLSGGPQMVEVSRDGQRVYFTNSLYGAWDDQFYPDGVGAWMAKLDVAPGRRASRSTSGSSRRGRLPRPAHAPGAAAGRRRVQRLLLLPLRALTASCPPNPCRAPGREPSTSGPSARRPRTGAGRAAAIGASGRSAG